MSIGIYNLTDTWTDSGTTYSAFKMSVTDTASANFSRFIRFERNGALQFEVALGSATGSSKNPYAYLEGAIGLGNGPGWFTGKTGDTESRAVLSINLSSRGELSFGPGNGGRDWFLARTGTNTAGITGVLNSNGSTSGLGITNIIDTSFNNLGRISWTAVAGNPAFVAGASKGWTIYTDDGNVRAVDFSATGGFSVGTTSDPGLGLIYTNSASFMLRTKTSLTGGGTGSVPTLTAGPANGNPTKWLPYDDNGTTRYVPAW